ncbi:MAG: hypothetical protein NTY75_01835 [Candidatus Shapirobacteria bacterium]|nr:hypothetical protein [Candidatus Shapirobacteria bacterium]
MYKLLLLLVTGILLSGCGTTISSQVQTNSVPIPNQEDIIRVFFSLIDEKRIPEAIGMMSEKAISNDSVKQEWTTQFNDFDSVKVVAVEKSIEENLYKVTLEAKVNLRAANYPIPYYGYGDKTDVRFIKLIKDSQGRWKIDGIATGP